MLNYETKGSRKVSINGNPSKSTVGVIDNEDWCMVCTVYAYNGGQLQAKKIFDEADTIFHAVVKYTGREGTPPDNVLEEGQEVILYRVGDYNSAGVELPELHEENPANYSWLCLVPNDEIIYVQDQGGGQGKQVEYREFNWVEKGEALQMIATDPVGHFHNGSSPFAVGRIYPAKRVMDEFLVYLPGHGNGDYAITRIAGGVIFTLTLDTQGNVINFEAVAE